MDGLFLRGAGFLYRRRPRRPITLQHAVNLVLIAFGVAYATPSPAMMASGALIVQPSALAKGGQVAYLAQTLSTFDIFGRD